MVKKICHLLINYGSKNQEYTSNLLAGLNQASKDHHFIYCHRAASNSKSIELVVANDKLRALAFFKIMKLWITNSQFRTLLKEIGLKNMLKWIWLIDYKIDVLHVHHEHVIPVVVLEYFKLNNVNIIITLRGRDLLVNTEQRNKTEELRKKLALASHIHCISKYIDSQLYRLFKLNGTIIYRGQEMPEEENIKTSFNNAQPLKIIAAGRLVWEKGHIFLIESIARLKNQGHAISVDIYGDGNLQEFLSFRIKQLNLESEIRLMGFIDNNLLKDQYKNYDLAVQPSLSEALSNGLIDFTFHNLPCVITDVGGMTEIVEHKVNGIVFSNKDMLLLDDAILQASNLDHEKLLVFNNKNRLKFAKTEEINKMLMLY